MINDLKSIGNSKKIKNAKGKKARKSLAFSTQRRHPWFHVGGLSSNIEELRMTGSKNSLLVPRRRSSRPGA